MTENNVTRYWRVERWDGQVCFVVSENPPPGMKQCAGCDLYVPTGIPVCLACWKAFRKKAVRS